MSFKNKRFTIWTDEVLWKSDKQGLAYGVYDNKLDRKCTDEEQGGRITSQEQARKKAEELNKL